MTTLPEPWLGIYDERAPAIRRRLEDFRSVHPDRYFYELAYCILTPQSTAVNATKAIGELERDHFRELGFDPTPYLRNAAHYVRFHNVKSKRLLHMREHYDTLHRLLTSYNSTPAELRREVLNAVPGLGMKEASHFLRNIGVSSLAILDRHIYKHLARLGVISEPPRSGPTTKRYLEIETAWHEYAASVGVPLDELDLLFWSMETGVILK